MPKCNRCGEAKSIEEFNWRYKDRGVRQRTCRSCQAKQKKKWYEKHGDKQRERVYRNRDRYRAEAKEFILEYLANHPCVDCGETDPVVLEFDHVKGKKRYNISTLVSDGYTVKKITKELAKCVVRCANCHRRKTAKDQGWFSS